MIVLQSNVYMQTFSDGVTMDFGTQTEDFLGQVLAINTWYHVCQVVVPTSTTSRRIYGYVNGKLQVNGLSTMTFSAYAAFTLGNSNFAPAWTWALDGNLRDVKIWKRALGATEVVQEMRSSMPLHLPDLLVWTPLDDDLRSDRAGDGSLIWTPGGAPGPVLQYGGPRGPRDSYVGRSLARF